MSEAVRVPPKLCPVYPFDFSETGEFEMYARDENGIPLVYYRHLGNRVYNPITIAQYGLHQLSLLTRVQNAQAGAEAWRMADWLVANLETQPNNVGAWVFHFDLPFYGPTKPWISALAQGQGISFLLRASQTRYNAKYEDACQRAVRAFYLSVGAGGVARTFPDGSLAFEEYPTMEPSLVLNGILFALIGLFDYATYFDDKRARDCFEAGMQGVQKNLFRYDTGVWNYYDLHHTRRLASPMYVDIHVRLLRVLAELSQEEIFMSTAQKWQKYLKSPACRAKYYAGKVREKIRLRLRSHQPHAPLRA